jgi:hypothetical protein
MVKVEHSTYVHNSHTQFFTLLCVAKRNPVECVTSLNVDRQ